MTEIQNFAEALNQNYEQYKNRSLKDRRIKHKNILPEIEKVIEKSTFKEQTLGHSTEGRSIHALNTGTGNTKVLLWSQMHGDEPTATQALFDIFNFFNNPDDLKDEAENILKKLNLHFIPMLNPDGAEVFKRRNGLDIDLNRDAIRMMAPETIILKKYRDELLPDWGFNLHDQNPYYTAGKTNNPATLSFLSPAYNLEKDVNEKRKQSMQLIALMDKVLQNFIPGQIGRYYDAYGPTSMGDNMQKWGTRTILIESGEYHPFEDSERQHVRKMNFIAILSALKGIADNVYEKIDKKEYWQIPEIVSDKFFHILIRNAIIHKSGNSFKIDIGIRLNEIPDEHGFDIRSEIYDLGDLTFYHAYHEIDAQNAVVKDFNNNKITLDIGSSADFILEKEGKTFLKIKNGVIE